jgi:hypothetical protein
VIFLDKKRRIATNGENLRSKGREIIEDTTEYGEFVCTFDSWLPIEEQKRNAEYMEHLGD